MNKNITYYVFPGISWIIYKKINGTNKWFIFSDFDYIIDPRWRPAKDINLIKDLVKNHHLVRISKEELFLKLL